MDDLTVLDCEKPVALNKSEYSAYKRHASPSEAVPFSHAGTDWDFYRVNRAGDVYAFREERGRYIGYKTTLCNPRICSFERQNNLTPEELQWFKESRQKTYVSNSVRHWIEQVMQQYGADIRPPDLSEKSFRCLSSDEELWEEVGRKQESWAAFVRGGLCFVNTPCSEYIVFKGKDIIADGVDFRAVAKQGGPSSVCYVINNLRRYSSIASPAGTRER